MRFGGRLWIKILVCVAICLILGFVSGMFTTDSINGWYQTINKPSWNPPNWLFGPVWTLLYILMGIAVALIWHSNSHKKRTAILFFIVQFALNIFWSYIFFYQKNIIGALAEMIIMLCLIIITMYLFFKIDKKAGWLMMPYIYWVSFATFLTYTIYTLN